MSKRVRTIIIVLIVVVLLAGGLTTVLLLTEPADGGESGSSDTSTDTISLLDKTTDSDGNTLEKPVTKVEVETPDETFTIADNADGILSVEDYADLPVHSTNIESLTGALASISANRKLESPEAPSEYGFDDPLARVTATYADGSTYSFEIGAMSEVSDEAYFRQTDSSDIYMVTAVFAETVSQKSTAYIGTTLVSAPSVDENDEEGQPVLRSITLSGSVRDGETLTVRRSNSEDSDTLSMYTYIVEKPFLRGANDTNASEAFDTAYSLVADEAAFAHPTDKQKQECGFDKPYSVAEMTLAIETTQAEEGATTTTAASSSSESGEEAVTRYYNVQQYTVTVGKESPDGDGRYYVMVDGLDVIYLVSESSMPWLDVTYNDVATTMLFLQDITGIESISITENGEETLFSLTHDPEATDSDDMLTVKVDGEQKDTANFRNLYQVLMGVERIDDADETPTGEPDMIIQINPIDSQDETITARLYRTSGSRYTCVMQDGDRYAVSAGSVEAVSKQLANYLAGQEVLVY